jgi:hypothetical protein
VSELDISDDDDEGASPVQQRSLQVPNEPVKDEIEDKREELEAEELDEEDTDSDSWSEYDNSDDDDHALVRTVSGRPFAIAVEVRGQTGSNSGSVTQSMEDYFQPDHSKSAVDPVQDVLNLGEIREQGEDDKKDVIVSITPASETLSPLASPLDDVVVG